jgi:hypothetical protein
MAKTSPSPDIAVYGFRVTRPAAIISQQEKYFREKTSMTSPIVSAASRRRFLQYLAGSPLLASSALSAYGAETPSKLPDPMIWAPAGGDLIKSPKDAINVFEFEPVARQNTPPAHFVLHGLRP